MQLSQSVSVDISIFENQVDRLKRIPAFSHIRRTQARPLIVQDKAFNQVKFLLMQDRRLRTLGPTENSSV